MKTLLTLLTLSSLAVCAAAPRSAAAQVCCDPCSPCETYRVVYKQVMEQKQVTAYRLERETVYETRKIVTHKPIWETSYQERQYTVRKAVCETAEREEQCVSYVPQTVYKNVTVDRGCWQDQTVCVPGPVTNRLACKPPSCVVDPVTGVSRYDRGGLVWVPVQGPSQQVVQRVWKPNVVVEQVPETQMAQKITVRKVPVQTVRYVDEPRVERIPVQTCKMVAEEREIQVPVCVEKQVPYTYTCSVPRLVAYREPICGGVCDTCATSAAVVVEQPAAQVVQPAAPPAPPMQPAPPAAPAQDGQKTFADEEPMDGAQSVKKEPAEEEKKAELPNDADDVDPGVEDKAKGGEVEDDEPFKAPF
jgi:hypothetical protein